MFEWFEEEIAAIKTPRFHVVDGPIPELKRAESALAKQGEPSS
jgi:hypothetical protein